jgi:hypothetical protein
VTLIEVLKLVAGDGYAYLASPYSKYHACCASPNSNYQDGMEAAFRDVCLASAWLLRRGVSSYSPIVQTHSIAAWGGINPADHDIWLPFDRPMMDAARGLIVVKMPTWEESYGVAHEIKVFAEAGKPMCFLSWPLPEDVACQ